MKSRYIILILLIVCLIIGGDYINISEIIQEVASRYKQNLDLVILVEVDQKNLSLIDKKSGQIIVNYPIASGKENSPTPLGNYNIIKKAHWGEGFGSRWLGLNVPWGNYGIHGTNKPGSIGSNASAGCIRMRNSDVEDLYDRVSLNTNVIIVNGDYGPFGNGFRNLRPGDRGADVIEVQKRLNKLGFYDGEFDGIYGEGMKKALIDFLKENNMELTDKINEELYNKLGIILMD